MKYVCLRCSQISSNGHLLCQDPRCPAGDNPIIFDSGEWIGDIEILAPITITRTAALYEAKRHTSSYLLKTALPGHQEALKREAQTLHEISIRARGRIPSALPRLEPPYADAPLEQAAYGKAVVQKQLVYYELFTYQDVEPLRGYLQKNPYPWYKHASWIVFGIADAIELLHQSGRLHLCLSPDLVLIRRDADDIPRPILFDLGVATGARDALRMWQPSLVEPEYTSPEFAPVSRRERDYVGTETDVYGLGMILYEMLAGSPAYSQPGTMKEEQIFSQVLRGKPNPLFRPDLPFPEISEALLQSISVKPGQRPKNVQDFYFRLHRFIGAVPKERVSRRWNWKTAFVVLGSLLALSLLCVSAVIIGSGT